MPQNTAITQSDKDAALQGLRRTRARIAALDAPSEPGVYAIYLRANGLPAPFQSGEEGLIYVGQSACLADREYAQPFSSSGTGRSTLRSSLGAILKRQLALCPIPRATGHATANVTNYRFVRTDEDRLTEWMQHNLDVGIHPSPHYLALEDCLVPELKPLLNLTKWRNPRSSEIEHLRKACADEAQRIILSFSDQLREARENALRNSEAFDQIVYVVERLGSLLCGKVGDLGKYKEDVEETAMQSALAEDIPAQWRGVHVPFSLLYDLVKDARNDALHQGAYARHLTTHAIELSLVLEDALRRSSDSPVVGDFMARNPICAELWQPISFVRQQMLANSFSFLPVKNAVGTWCLVSEIEIATHLAANGQKRKLLLAQSLEKAGINLQKAERCTINEPIGAALGKLGKDTRALLVFNDQETLVGIVTPFDLL